MSSALAAPARTGALFHGLLDDAAVFPPGNAPMPAAVAAYTASRASADAAFIGSFVCSAPRLGELRDALPAQARIALALVVPGGVEALPAALAAATADERLLLRAVELPAGAAGVAPALEALDATLPDDALAYVEVPLDEHVADHAKVIADAGRRVKMRTGGTTADAFPSSERLAAGLVACTRAGAPFKLTAGLHSAVRHRDSSTGFEHHGFLDVLAAVARAADGGDAASVADLLEERDAAPLAEWAATLSDADVARVRQLFVGFGTCSTAEPLADLRALGLVPAGAA